MDGLLGDFLCLCFGGVTDRERDLDGDLTERRRGGVIVRERERELYG